MDPEQHDEAPVWGGGSVSMLGWGSASLSGLVTFGITNLLVGLPAPVVIAACVMVGVIIIVTTCVITKWQLDARTRRTESALANANAAARPGRTIRVRDAGGLEYTIEDRNISTTDD